MEPIRVRPVDRDPSPRLLLHSRVVEHVVLMAVRVQDLEEPQAMVADRRHGLALAA